MSHLTLFDRITEKAERYLRSYFAGRLNRRRSQYRQLYRNDMKSLRRMLRPGDVILVEGDYWVSDWIKVFSHHTWTHCVLYVGNSPALPAGVKVDFVDPSGDMVEALISKGVILNNLEKYSDLNLRVCRPIGLSRDRLAKAIHFVTGKIGFTYDQENLAQFVRYAFADDADPRKPLGDPAVSSFTCSSLIAAAFQTVGFPIIHRYDRASQTSVVIHPSQVQPKDFDLSPNFEVIKPPVLVPAKKRGFFRRLLERLL